MAQAKKNKKSGSQSTTIPKGLRVVVTAGASGIGRVIAESFADAGARVFVCDVQPKALADLKRQRPDIRSVQADVAVESEMAELFKAARKAFGGLDVLVNNAGIAGPTGGVDEIKAADWDRTVAINLNGQFYCLNHAVPMIKKSRNGAIIGISSVAGRLGYAYRTPYSATKWAIVGLTKSLAIELGPSGVRVNCILPGVVRGERIRRVIAARAKTLGLAYAVMEKQYLQKVSLRRMVTPQDVASMALFLCSPAGANISGQALSVCGNVETL
ncbi:MAG: SDR family oxidoreductase [Alphaproteobacteria bacterium]|nr:SDR family oxidoreductase [Alphaproteobacteria bacterium]